MTFVGEPTTQQLVALLIIVALLVLFGHYTGYAAGALSVRDKLRAGLKAGTVVEIGRNRLPYRVLALEHFNKMEEAMVAWEAHQTFLKQLTDDQLAEVVSAEVARLNAELADMLRARYPRYEAWASISGGAMEMRPDPNGGWIRVPDAVLGTVSALSPTTMRKSA
jgi:hypothetical protein